VVWGRYYNTERRQLKIKMARGQRACIDNRFGFKEIFNWVDDRRIAVNKKKLSNFSAMKNRVAL
jgi:hypothetical protein